MVAGTANIVTWAVIVKLFGRIISESIYIANQKLICAIEKSAQYSC